MTDIEKLIEDLEYARYHCTSSKGKDAINDALDLINRQQEEIERLTERDEIAERIIREQGGAILSLKNENSRLSEKDKKAIITCIAERDKAIKEFAERLKKQIYIKDDRDFYGEKIDNLVKEMVGEDETT